MAPISRICQYLTSSIRSKYVHKRLNNPVKTGSSPWRGLALRWWTGGAIGTGAAYFLGKKICPTGPFTHAIQNIYSTFFGSSTVKTPSIPNEISRKVVSPSGIEKINNDLYISRRAEDTDLTFVLSRLTDDNLDVWWRLHGRWGTRRGSEVLRKLCDDDQCKGWTDKQMEFFTAGIEAGAMAFRHTLQMYEASQTDAIRPEIWISYALSGKNIDPAKPIHESLFPHVEIAMTALTHPDVPVVVHMGIGRTTYNTKSICNGVLPQHKELSIPLHGFTAKAILETPQGHDKMWLYTSPALTMAKILNKALPK
ncbi:MAG TPA: hypothetical protein VFV08_12205, partial [Puia sp.]|nr:hypothetical protein [Puia sp.]